MVALAGCQGMTSGGTVYTMTVTREVQAYLPTDSFTAHYAAMEVLERDYLYSVTSDAVDARQGRIEARTATNTSVRVETARAGEGLTRIDIFVAPLGNETAAADILGSIERRIRRAPGATQVTAAPTTRY